MADAQGQLDAAVRAAQATYLRATADADARSARATGEAQQAYERATATACERFDDALAKAYNAPRSAHVVPDEVDGARAGMWSAVTKLHRPPSSVAQ
jgi:hypothetical protein